MLCRPTQTCFWAGRLTPAIRAMWRISKRLAAGHASPASELESLSRFRDYWKPRGRSPGTRHGERAHAPATVRGWPRPGGSIRPARPARYSGARIGPGPPGCGTAARVAHLPVRAFVGAGVLFSL